ncbi:MAG: S9 family peptidase [Nitrospirales bacterium]|nr:S9 family peptidase [Nitrospira sp.]MDR4501545.1 S9 family peptidase [Nitrospirales bacterium]
MTSVNVSPYGSWKSPLTSGMIVAQAVRLGQIQVTAQGLFWVEGRPTEGGRNVIVRRTSDADISDITPSTFNVRSRVHEYGGAAYLIANEAIYFSNDSDQRVYRHPLSGAWPEPMTDPGPFRYADFTLDASRNRLIAIREDHSVTDHEPSNAIVSISLDESSKEPREQLLVQGYDFYASPRLSPDGRQLAWLSWNHPNMPWDGCELWVADFDADGAVTEGKIVAGGPEESIFQPEWSPTGTLYFISDRTGWWNLYRIWQDEVNALFPMEAEWGLPQWNFGLSTYGFHSPTTLACLYTQEGNWHLATLDVESRQLSSFDLSYPELSDLRVFNGHAYCLASSPTEPHCLIQVDLLSNHHSILYRSRGLPVSQDYLSTPEAITYPTENGQQAHAFFYPPHNPDFSAPSQERPPLIVKSHGGPTGATDQSFDVMIQYWTSRGFAVLDVNYGGSTGYGRTYRARLNGQWGIVDIDDCVNGVKSLIRQDKIDPKRVAIMGGSAGGYTTLCALTFRDIFSAGSSHYGVSDLEALARDTHKFESRYLHGLVGPYPEERERYQQRSPIHHASQLSCPIILFQGLEDKVVPPDQAGRMVEALNNKGLPVAYVAFEGEQHGFRKADNIKRVLDVELYFYSRIFKFSPADPIEPIQILNFS